MNKIKAALTFLKVEDFILGLAFAFWVWLGKALDVRIQIPVPEPWVITKEVTVIDTEAIEQIAALRAENEELKSKLAEAGHQAGPGRPNAKKLTEREVKDIRDYHRMGWKNVDLARAFDVNPATISRIVRGQYYPKLTAA